MDSARCVSRKGKKKKNAIQDPNATLESKKYNK